MTNLSDSEPGGIDPARIRELAEAEDDHVDVTDAQARVIAALLSS